MNSLLNIWGKIISECEQGQVLDGKYKGLVRNFLINGFYYRESAFAAKIFAVEYLRTKKEIYLNRAEMALNCLQKILKENDITQGLDEPMWTPRGVKYRKGSIPSTIIFLYSIEEATKLINYDFKYESNKIIDYLSSCYLGRGRFYHDKIAKNNKSHKMHVINTTAMAYYFLELSHSKGINSNFYESEIKIIENSILRSQRGDGFFSYIEPNNLQRIYWNFSKILPSIITKIYNKVLNDSSIFFGDAIHHVITLYYFLVAKRQASKRLSNYEVSVIKKGWQFIRSNLQEYQKGYIRFDFSWEPKPNSLRYCNFIDTSTYFYILDLLRLLEFFGLIEDDIRHYYTNGILNHIETKLLSDNRPSILPYEGSEEIIQNIIPRPSESVFDKGFFLSNVMAHELNLGIDNGYGKK